jgi:hypothetical protein
MSASAIDPVSNRRRLPRLGPAHLKIPLRVNEYDARLVDLSLLGLRVEMDEEFLPGALLPVQFTVGEKQTTLRALVRRAEPYCFIEDGLDLKIRYHLGMEFLREPKADATVLEDLMTWMGYAGWAADRVPATT